MARRVVFFSPTLPNLWKVPQGISFSRKLKASVSGRILCDVTKGQQNVGPSTGRV